MGPSLSSKGYWKFLVKVIAFGKLLNWQKINKNKCSIEHFITLNKKTIYFIPLSKYIQAMKSSLLN